MASERPDRLDGRAGPTWWPRCPARSGRPGRPGGSSSTPRWPRRTTRPPCGPRRVALADRRAAGEPLQYVLGTWAFRHLELAVDRRVLIPRPETEQVVEVALGELARIASTRTRDAGPAGLRRPRHRFGGHRPVPGRRGRVARAPARGVGHRRVARRPGRGPGQPGRPGRRPTRSRRPGDVRRRGRGSPRCPTRLARRVDLVVANPPYVAEEEYADLDPTVRDWEPRSALVAPRGRGGVAGMADIEAVVAGAGAWLRHGRGPWSSSWRRPRPTGRSTPHGGPGSPGWGRPATWPVGCACWWRNGDPGAACRRAGRTARGGRRAGRRGGGGGAHRHRLRPGRRPDPARRGRAAVRPEGPPADVPLPVLVAGTEQVALVAGDLEAAARAPGRALLARSADPGRAPAAGLHRRPRAVRPPPARRSGCVGPTIRWSSPSASCSARWPSPAPTCTGRRRPPRPTRWCGPSPGPTSPRWCSTVATCDGRAVDGGRVPGSGLAVPPGGGAALGRAPRGDGCHGTGARPGRRAPPGLTVPVPTGDTCGMQHVESSRRVTVIIID